MYCCQPRVIAQHGTGALEHPAAGRFAALCAARRSVGRLLDTPALVWTLGTMAGCVVREETPRGRFDL